MSIDNYHFPSWVPSVEELREVLKPIRIDFFDARALKQVLQATRYDPPEPIPTEDES